MNNAFLPWITTVQLLYLFLRFSSGVLSLFYIFSFTVLCCFFVQQRFKISCHGSTCPQDPMACWNDVWGNCELYVGILNCLVYTEANSFPWWKRPMQPEAHVFHLPPVVLTFQQIGLHVFDVCDLYFRHFVGPQFLQEDIKREMWSLERVAAGFQKKNSHFYGGVKSYDWSGCRCGFKTVAH